jgi:hypothetical protein
MVIRLRSTGVLADVRRTTILEIEAQNHKMVYGLKKWLNTPLVSEF